MHLCICSPKYRKPHYVPGLVGVYCFFLWALYDRATRLYNKLVARKRQSKQLYATLLLESCVLASVPPTHSVPASGRYYCATPPLEHCAETSETHHHIKHTVAQTTPYRLPTPAALSRLFYAMVHHNKAWRSWGVNEASCNKQRGSSS